MMQSEFEMLYLQQKEIHEEQLITSINVYLLLKAYCEVNGLNMDKYTKEAEHLRQEAIKE